MSIYIYSVAILAQAILAQAPSPTSWIFVSNRGCDCRAIWCGRTLRCHCSKQQRRIAASERLRIAESGAADSARGVSS